VALGGRQRERRFPAGTPLAVLEAERRAMRGELRILALPAARTLDHDIAAYLRTYHDRRRQRGAAILLAHWSVLHGSASRWALTPLVIRQQLAAWRMAGVAANTCNHRLSSLRGLFRTLNTLDEPNPAADIRKLEQPPSRGRALDYRDIVRILDAMPLRGRATRTKTRPAVNLSRLRLTVMAYTGLPQEQIQQIDPSRDIQWDAPALRARARRKGKGTRERWVPLLPVAVDALRQLVAAGALPARWSTSSLRMSWLRACRVVIREQLAAGEPPLPHDVGPGGAIRPRVRPYDLRHSFAAVALGRSANLAGTQYLLQHASADQTLVYGDAAIAPAATVVVGSLADLPVPCACHAEGETP